MKKEPLIIKDQSFTGERALFSTHNAHIENCFFHDGESPLKEPSDKPDQESCPVAEPD